MSAAQRQAVLMRLLVWRGESPWPPSRDAADQRGTNTGATTHARKFLASIFARPFLSRPSRQTWWRLAIAVFFIWSALGGIAVPSMLSPHMDNRRGAGHADLAMSSTIDRGKSAAASSLTVTAGISPATATAASVVLPNTPSLVGTWRLRIRAIGVDAPMQVLNLDPNGQMQAPADGDSVGWYSFSAEPGAAGNVVVAGHVDWVNRTAVFWNLRRLKAGDEITVATTYGDRRYIVTHAYTIPSETPDVTSIVGTRSGPSTLTMITCEGTFNPAKQAYNERLVVVAILRE